MAEANVEAARQWLWKARRDFYAAERLSIGDPPLLDTTVYHCQQAVEKGLKSFLTLKSIPFQKTHNLVALIDLCAPIEPEFLKWIETAIANTLRHGVSLSGRRG